jgi:hypothetical protein
LYYEFVSDSLQGLIVIGIGRALQSGFSYDAVTWPPMVVFIDVSLEK